MLQDSGQHIRNSFPIKSKMTSHNQLSVHAKRHCLRVTDWSSTLIGVTQCLGLFFVSEWCVALFSL